MVAYAMGDLVCLHLNGRGNGDDADGTTSPATATGLGDALGLGETMSDRIRLVSTLDELVAAGDVTEHAVGNGDERTAYRLTPAGRRRADGFERTVRDDQVVVHADGDSTRMTVETVVETHDSTLLSTVAAITDDGHLYLEDEVTEEFVGRDEQLAAFADALDAVRDGEARTILVPGSAGIGKTTVVERALEEADDVTADVAQCDRDGNAPYGPVRDAIGDAPFAVETSLEVSDEEEFDAQRRALFADVADGLRARAYDDGPLVVFIDDFHRADSATLDLCRFLTTELSTAPVCLVGAYRREPLADDHPLLADGDLLPDDSTVSIELDTFERTETRDLVHSLVGSRDVPGAFVDAVHERTGGNPLFVEETVKRMLEDGIVDPDVDVYPADVDALGVPEAVTDTIDLRLDAFDDDVHDLLERTAILGDNARTSVLSAWSEQSSRDIATILDLLVGAGLLVRTDDGVRFKSDVLLDAVYERIAAPRREQLHREAARQLDAELDDRRTLHEAIATHHERAGDDDSAIAAYRAAADDARDVYAHEVAIDRYRRALDLARANGREDVVTAVLEAIGDAATVTGDYEEADRDYRYVRQHTDDVGVQKRTYRKQAKVRRQRSEYDDVVALADDGLALADPEGPTRETGCLHSERGWGCLQRGDLDEAAAAFEREYEIARELDDPALLGDALHDLGTTTVKRGNLGTEPERTLGRAVATRGRAGDRIGLARSLNNLGLLYWKRGELAAASRHIERSLDVLQEIGDARGVSAALGNLGVLFEKRGDWATAREYYERSITADRRLGHRRGEGIVESNIALAHLMEGNLDAAVEHSERAIEIAREIDDRQGEAVARQGLANVHVARDEPTLAREHAERAKAIADDTGDRATAASVRGVLGDICREFGDVDAAVAHHEAALTVAQETDDIESVVLNRVQLSEAHRERGDVDAAFDAITNAVDDINEVADPVADVEAHIALASIHRVRGANDAAADAIEYATVAVTDLETPVLHAQVLLERGHLAVATDRLEAARQHYRSARDGAADASAHLYARHAAEALDALDD
jgi:tetratricopeptide (TPR) repeat protein